MLPARAWTLLMLVGTATLAGCLGTEDADTDPVNSVDPGTDPGTGGTGNTTVDPAALVPGLTADVLNGTAPLLVNLTLSAAGADDNTTWSVDFGDGNTTEGAGLPATVNHTFGPGNFTVTATFLRGNETATTNLTVSAVAGAVAGPSLPEVTHFEFADSLGCAGDFIAIVEEEVHLGLDCVSFVQGPAGSGIDGYWQELGPAYWGLSLTSTVDQGAGEGGVDVPEAGTQLSDSDCVFTDADHAVIGEGHNGGGTCAGIIPEGTQWLFIYPYATPGLSMTVDVALP